MSRMFRRLWRIVPAPVYVLVGLCMVVVWQVNVDTPHPLFAENSTVAVSTPTPTLNPNANTTIRIVPPSATIGGGETAHFCVVLENVPNLYGLDIQLGFDSTIIAIVDALPGTVGVNMEPGNLPSANGGGSDFIALNTVTGTSMRYAKVLLAPSLPQSGSGEVFCFTVRGLGNGDSPLNFVAITILDIHINSVPATVVNGNVVVIGASTSTPTTTPTATATPTPTSTPIPGSAKPAVWRAGTWFLRTSLSAGPAETVFMYGANTDKPLMCDWDGDGDKTPGVFRNGAWFLKNANAGGIADVAFAFGLTGDTPVCGDWNSDGIDSVGVIRDNVWYLRNTNSDGPADHTFLYGALGDIPVVGDWNGDGTDTPGIVRGGTWYLRNSNSNGNANLVFMYGIPPGDRPIVGDWNGDAIDTVGVTRGDLWLLRNTNTTGSADISFNYGAPGDKPLVWR